MAIRNVFKLKFGTNLGETASYTVPHASAALDAAAVSTAMQDMIDSEAVLNGAGSPVSILGAERVTYAAVPVEFE